MSTKSKTRYALLGMVAKKPKSGYEIKKDLEGGLSLFWSESYGQIYKVLKQLEGEKLLKKAHCPQRGKPSKDLYAITEEGLSELRRYLSEPAEKLVVRDEMMLKFIFGPLVDSQVSVRLLQNEIDKTEQKMEEVDQKGCEHLEELRDDPAHPHLERIVQLAKSYYRTRIKWCRESMALLKELP